MRGMRFSRLHDAEAHNPMTTIVHKPTVVLADDYARVLEEVSSLLEEEFDIVGTAHDGSGAVRAVAVLKPDVVVLDIAMPGTNGIEAAHEFRNLGLAPKLVFLTGLEDTDHEAAASDLGASYVLKCRMASDLMFAIREALAGRRFVSDLSIH
jgi:DNA-binding NarL/FixJ family response regulator